jgi:hypothetical protein
MEVILLAVMVLAWAIAALAYDRRFGRVVNRVSIESKINPSSSEKESEASREDGKLY